MYKRQVLDACLFEPGLWQAVHNKAPVEVVPPPTEDPSIEHDVFATPVGLLFNELVNEPQIVVDAIISMLSTVLEMDEGKYSERSSPKILYVVRLAVRVEAYLLALIEHTEDQSHNHTRGMICPAQILPVVKRARSEVRTLSLIHI